MKESFIMLLFIFNKVCWLNLFVIIKKSKELVIKMIFWMIGYINVLFVVCLVVFFMISGI